MRLFRKKSDSPGQQEYLDGLISSIRQARREELERSGLHAFVEADDFPVADTPSPPRVPPGAGKADTAPDTPPPSAEAEEIANLEAYLSALEAADAAAPDDEPEEDGFASR